MRARHYYYFNRGQPDHFTYITGAGKGLNVGFAKLENKENHPQRTHVMILYKWAEAATVRRILPSFHFNYGPPHILYMSMYVNTVFGLRKFDGQRSAVLL